jgi:TP901 family phage tail tape measure protein
MEGLVGIQRDQIDAWRGDIRSLATDYGSSATEAADALFFITSAGLRGADAMDTLEASLKASAAGLGDVTTIADLSTSAMNAYGSDVLSAAGATDVLTAAVREGKLEPRELAGAMGSVLPIASEMGIRFDELGAAMAAMSRTGTNAAQASTQLRSIMTSLLRPTADAEAQLEEMGLSASGLRRQIREDGLLSVLQTLDAEFQANEDAAARVFGNVRALSGVLDMMGVQQTPRRRSSASWRTLRVRSTARSMRRTRACSSCRRCGRR